MVYAIRIIQMGERLAKSDKKFGCCQNDPM
jgi:hypothetical protein